MGFPPPQTFISLSFVLVSIKKDSQINKYNKKFYIMWKCGYWGWVGFSWVQNRKIYQERCIILNLTIFILIHLTSFKKLFVRLVQLPFRPHHWQFFLSSSYPFVLKKESEFASETFLRLYKTTRRHIKDNLSIQHCDTLNVIAFSRIRRHLTF